MQRGLQPLAKRRADIVPNVGQRMACLQSGRAFDVLLSFATNVGGASINSWHQKVRPRRSARSLS
jgi:hypothetical protein